MKSTWITYKDKKIFYANYEYLRPNEHKVELVEVEKELLQYPLKSVLCLINVTGVPITAEVLEGSKNISLRTANRMRKAAIIGLGDSTYFKFVLDVVYRFSGMYFVACKDEQEAKEWLIR